MRPRVRPTPLPWFPLLVSACTDWPRFAADLQSITPFDGIYRPFEVLESADWAGDPSTLGTSEPVTLISPMDSASLIGTLDPYGSYEIDAGVQPFPSCPGISSSVAGVYRGDVDMIRIRHPGGSLCLHLETPGEPLLWDVVAYVWDGACAAGPFLTLPAEELSDQPASLAPGDTNVAVTDSEEIVVYLAGVSVIDPPAAVPYTLDIVSTRDPGLCSRLTTDSFGEPR